MAAPQELIAADGVDVVSALRAAAQPHRLDGGVRALLRRTWLDTADRRLLRHGVALLHDVTDDRGELTLCAADASAVTVPASAPPVCAQDLPAPMRTIADVIDVRALLVLARADIERTLLAVLDDLDKTVARVSIERVSVDDAAVTRRVRVSPLRGYDRIARQLAQRLAADDSMVPATETVLDTLLLLTGEAELKGHGAPGEGLTRQAAAGESFALLLRHLLDAIEVNVDGSVSGVDTEFLHDLRVAVRRTRTALKLGHGVVDDEARTTYGEGFRWLGDVTTPARDLDVHLLEFPAVVELLPPDFAGALSPVHDYLERQHKAVRRALSRDLRSTRFKRLVREWSRQLDTGFTGPEAEEPLGPIADQRVQRAWRKVLKKGSAITDESAPERLHDLRKRCKELRYALEFFGGLYDAKTVKGLVKELKTLQDNLGSYQDSEVQRHTVEQWASALGAEGAPAATLVAIGRLAAAFDERQARTRAEFYDTFARFARRENRQMLAEMLSTT